MAAHLSTADLLKQMSGKSTLNGWDVLVSYDEARINELLSNQPGLQHQSIDLAFSTEEEDLDGDIRDVEWNVKLSNPKLQFIGTKAQISLTFAMGGTRTVGKGKPRLLAEGFNVAIQTQLMNVRGSSTEEGFVPAQDPAAVPDNVVVELAGQHDVTRAICIDLKSESLPIDIVPVVQGRSLPTLLGTLQSRLREHIRPVGFKYHIAGLSNVYRPEQSSELLKPRTFCFTCVAGKDGKPGSLCMWIGLEGSSGGTLLTGQTILRFPANQTDVHPIPETSHASVIFSHEVMANYLKSALMAKKVYEQFTVITKENAVGFEIKAKCTKKVSKSFQEYNKNNQFEGATKNTETYSDVSFDMRDNNTTFKFGDEGKFREIKISYVSNTQLLKWWGRVEWVGTSFGDAEQSVAKKDTSLRFGHGGTAKWEDGGKTGGPNLLKLKFTMPKEFAVLDQRTEGDPEWIWEVGTKPERDVPEFYRKIRLALPDLDLELGGLDYFLTTNLIMPGARIFIADNPSGTRGKDYGLFMPRDVLLTGNVATRG